MNTRRALLLVAALFCGSLAAGAGEPAPQPQAAAQANPAAVADPLAPLARLVGGQWRGEIKLLDGAVIRARHVFEWGLGGKILKSKTYGAFSDRPEQLVYEGLFAWHPEKKKITFQEVAAYGGTNEGTIEPEGNALHYHWTQSSSSGATIFKETLIFPDNDHYTSEAYKQTENGWEKFTLSSSFRREALDSMTAGRTLRKAVTVEAPLAEVWNAWTTTEGVKTFFGPGARVEAAPGGPFEIYFSLNAPEGLRGSERCKVHSVVPMKLFAFTWNQPPIIPALRDVQTLVVLRLEEVAPGKVRVEMTHSGWGVGEDWDKAYAYFDRAWDAVLGNLQYRFTVGPVDWPEGRFRVAQADSKQ
jgi:uncharacterized protein YndB with AHSA1/START domain